MVGFEYHGSSTENIIGTPLYLIAYEGIDGLGTSRSKVEGERTISRFVTNEYGTIYEPLSFTYALMKSDGEPFTEEEQRTVERWLTSPKLSSELKITNCSEYSYSYFGLFTNTRWEIGNGGLAMCVFTFLVNGAYPYKYYYVERMKADLPLEENGELFWSFWDMGFDCYTDELEEYVYPTIKARAAEGNSQYNSSFKITQKADNDSVLSVTTTSKETVVVDCRNCRTYLETKSGAFIKNLSFKDMNWEDADDIYWLRLVPGFNFLEIDGDVEMTIGYYAPYKKIGGWLV